MNIRDRSRGIPRIRMMVIRIPMDTAIPMPILFAEGRGAYGRLKDRS
jgi:hypothetical protein